MQELIEEYGPRPPLQIRGPDRTQLADLLTR
jgi:hypothetical protein